MTAFHGREKNAETRDRTGVLQIFSLTLSQLSYRGLNFWPPWPSDACTNACISLLISDVVFALKLVSMKENGYLHAVPMPTCCSYPCVRLLIFDNGILRNKLCDYQCHHFQWRTMDCFQCCTPCHDIFCTPCLYSCLLAVLIHFSPTKVGSQIADL